MPSAPATSSAPPPDVGARPARVIAMLGNPNVGKTTLFNRLCGLRQKTSNFPGTTQDARIGWISAHGAGAPATCCEGAPAQRPDDAGVCLIDLPGLYSLDLDVAESRLSRQVLDGETKLPGVDTPGAQVIVLDATNLVRNLVMAGEALRRGDPSVVVVNVIDTARRRGIHVDADRLSECLGCPVVACSARTGEGLERLRAALDAPGLPTRTPPDGRDALERWAEQIYAVVGSDTPEHADDTLTDRLDRAFTHPVLGVTLFALAMTGLFWVIFRLAAYPMDWIDMIFARLGGAAESALPPGVLRDLLVDGVIAGVGATIIFLPQICLLFFLISLLEDTGYLARAAFVIDRLLRPFGLSGHAFVPLLSAHACALPGIMAARAVPDRRDRLATILVAPFMSCTARIPVYVLLTTLLFPERPAMQAVAFTGCYVLGIVAALISSLIARRTILRGRTRPMALELPSYRLPSLRTALLTTYDRGRIFVRKAGTLILGISIVLWWLGEYPHTSPPPESTRLRLQAAESEPDAAADLLAEADAFEARHAAQNSFLGRLGAGLQPAFAPLGYDRQLTIGVLASFAAREVFVTTMAVQVVGSDDVEDEGVFEALAGAERDDGAPIFTTATSWSLLIYYVLAMQCLPTLVVTAREAGGVRWALLQLAWMFGLAYALAFVVYQSIVALGAA